MFRALRGLGSGRLRAVSQVSHRGLHAALFVGHASEIEGHFDAAEGADDGQIIGVAEVSDAEGLA